MAKQFGGFVVICWFVTMNCYYVAGFTTFISRRMFSRPPYPPFMLTAMKGSARDEESSRAQPTSALEVHVIGVSIHHAQVEVREKLAIKQENWAVSAAELIKFSSGVIEEAAVLSTCNRFELYLSSRDSRGAIKAATSWLSSKSGVSQQTLRNQLFLLSGEDAGWHLLRVSAGLDSLVVGEGQILAQVSACFQTATQKANEDNSQVAGSGGKILSKMLNTAVAAGKRVRTETAISKGAVSISSAAVEFSKSACQKHLGKSIADCRVMIVGAGNMTKLLIAHLKSQRVDKITLVSKSIGPMSNAANLASEHQDIEWTLRLSNELYDALTNCDLAFFSTSSTSLLLTVDDLKNHMETQSIRVLSKQPICLVDISVPRNVDALINNIPGCFAFNVDHLKDTVARNTANRRIEMLEAEELLKEELSRYLGWHQSLGAVPKIMRLKEMAENIRSEEISKIEKKLKNLSEKEMKLVQQMSRSIVNKLLHSPMVHLRSVEDIESKRRTINTFSAMFGLDEKK